VISAGHVAEAILALATTFGLAIGGLIWLKDKTLPAWVLVPTVAAVLISIAVAFFLGRRSYRALPASAAQRARDELEVARNYLSYIKDFSWELREALALGPPAESISRLGNLRDLVFDAIIQGINTAPGEHIRCLFLEPVTEGGETTLRPRHHRGHTARVAELRLAADHGSIAGIAFSNREPEYVPNAIADRRVQQTAGGRRIETLFCLPAFGYRTANPDPIGVFSVASNQPDAFSPSDQIFVAACANIVGLIEFFISIFEGIEAEAASGRPPALESSDAAELPEGTEGDAENQSDMG
jgi:hypothetical protein